MIFLPEERTIKKKRACKHCSNFIYLQHIAVAPGLQWISFEATDGKLHLCPKRPFDFKTRKLIQEAIDRMNYSHNTNNKVSLLLLNNIDTVSSRT